MTNPTNEHRDHRTYSSELTEWGYCVDCYEMEHDSECVSDEEDEA